MCSRLVLAAAMLCCATQAFAQDAAPRVRDLAPEWQPVAPATLAALRGGFDIPGATNISFGIERAVYINGALVVDTRAQIPDLAQMTTAQATQLADAIAPLIVRNGAGNVADVVPGNVGTLTIVQNSLDNQRIAGMTTLSVGVGTLGDYQARNAASALQDTLVWSATR